MPQPTIAVAGATGDLGGHVQGDHVVVHDVGQLLEPPRAQRRQHGALVRDRRAEHVVVGADPVARDHEDDVVAPDRVPGLGRVELTHLAGDEEAPAGDGGGG